MLLTTLPHRADPTTQNYLAQNVNSAKADAEKKQKKSLVFLIP